MRRALGRTRLHRALIGITAAAATAATTLVSLPTAATESDRPMLSLKTATRSVTIESYGNRVYLDLGTHVVAGDEPFEIHAKRTRYAEAITAKRVIGDTTTALPDVRMKNFAGLPGFLRTQIRNRAGDVVVDRFQRFCPNNEMPSRLRVDAPSRSPYPMDCPTHPFTRGAVMGLQEGWGSPTFLWSAPPARLAPGRYTATVDITSRYRRMFDIPAAAATLSLTVRVVRGEDGCGDCRFAGTGGVSPPPLSRSPQTEPTPRADGPTAAVTRKHDGPLPDLRSLPAFGIEVMHRRRVDRDFLMFGANVWNAGRTPLVVDGFRREHEAVMDAYQYFYDAEGDEVGYAPTGAMEWDSRDGHLHWHFKDFARYRLLDADKRSVVRSRKEAFCLANTDAVDYTVPGANWRPGGTDLHTACGGRRSLSVREVLDAGSGDSYYQYVPGQSFNITSLPNGTYFIEVRANPMNRLHESRLDNNVSYRKVLLRGEPGNRRVRVPQLGLVVERR